MAGNILDSPIVLVEFGNEFGEFKIHQMNWLFYAPHRSQQEAKWPLISKEFEERASSTQPACSVY